MSDVGSPNPNETWRNFNVASPIAACRLRSGDLKRLYRIINEKQAEHRDRVVPRLLKEPSETSEQFATRVSNARNAFITTVRVTALNGEIVTGHGENFFDSSLIPEQIVSISYDTSFSPAAILKYTPSDRVYVNLDFSQPRFLNFGIQPSAPTPNESNFVVTAETESWSTSLTSRLRNFFSEKATPLNWLHAPSIYDLLVMTVGLPFALWGSYKFGSLIIGGKGWPSPILIGIYVYLFLFFLHVFRAIFMYSRWIFPKVELATENSSKSSHHKAILAVVLLGVVASAIWDAIKVIIAS